MIKRAFSSLIAWIIAFQLVSITIGYVTRFGMYPWYGQLIKSSLTPPGYYFGIIWPLLYISLAILGWKLHKEREKIMESSIFYFALKRGSTLDINFTCRY